MTFVLAVHLQSTRAPERATRMHATCHVPLPASHVPHSTSYASHVDATTKTRPNPVQRRRGFGSDLTKMHPASVSTHLRLRVILLYKKTNKTHLASYIPCAGPMRNAHLAALVAHHKPLLPMRIAMGTKADAFRFVHLTAHAYLTANSLALRSPCFPG